MISEFKEEIKLIISDLKSLGCCPRCVLRYVGVKTLEVYKSLQDVKQKISSFLGDESDDCEPTAKRERTNTCVICFGILQELCETSSAIVAAVKEADFESREFVLSLSIPLCSILREHFLQVHVKEKYPKFYRAANIRVPSFKEVWKWNVAPFIEKEFNVSFSIASPFDISVITRYSEDKIECANILRQLHYDGITAGNKKNQKNSQPPVSRSMVEKALASLEDSEILKNAPWPPSVPSSSAFYDGVECSHKSVFVAGRYNKYSRSLCQTPWLIEGEKLMETSIKELICDSIEPHFKADEVKFSASGREDVDVRTLGKGRPFVLEFLNPRRVYFDSEKMSLFQKEINTSTNDIAVRDLQIVSRDDISELKAGEEEKTKTYTALCFSQEPLTTDRLSVLKDFQNVTLFQKTPIRVLHRRPLAVREKVIHNMKAELIDDHHFHLRLRTQAGTYIKEFVHGDFGRTQPSLGCLLKTETDILELDVESVELDWPPSLEEIASEK